MNPTSQQADRAHLTVVILIVAVCVLVFAGCGKKANTGVTVSSGRTPNPNKTETSKQREGVSSEAQRPKQPALSVEEKSSEPVQPKVDAQAQDRAARVIEQQGGIVQFDRNVNEGREAKVVTEAYLSQQQEISAEIVKALTTLKGLRRLRLPRCGVTDEHLKQLSTLTNLELLDLRSTQVTDAGMAFLPRLSRLRFLHLGEDESPISDKGLPPLLRLPALEVLDLRGAQITDSGLATLGRMIQLVELDVSECLLTGAGLTQLKELKQLRRLNVGRSLADFEKQSSWRLPPLPSLETMDAGGTTAGDAFLQDLARLPKLRRLRMQAAFNVSDNGARALKDLPLLELRLASTEITNAALKAVGEIRSLELLDLRYTQITGDGLRQLGPLKLQALWLGGTQIGDTGLTHLGEQSKLSTLELSGVGVSDEGLLQLSALKNLRMLDLRDNVNITNQGMKYLAAFTELRYLNLGGVFLSDDGLQDLKPLTQLRGLDLRGTDVSDRSITILKQFPELIDINLDETYISTEADQALRSHINRRNTRRTGL